MSQRWDDVDSEANQKGPDGRVNRAKEGEDYGQEPYRDNNWESGQCPQTDAPCVMHPYHLLPHEVQWRTCEPKCNKLQHPCIFISKSFNILRPSQSLRLPIIQNNLNAVEWINLQTWWMSIRITAASRQRVLGRREKALEWLRSWSPKAQ